MSAIDPAVVPPAPKHGRAETRTASDAATEAFVARLAKTGRGQPQRDPEVEWPGLTEGPTPPAGQTRAAAERAVDGFPHAPVIPRIIHFDLEREPHDEIDAAGSSAPETPEGSVLGASATHAVPATRPGLQVAQTVLRALGDVGPGGRGTAAAAQTVVDPGETRTPQEPANGKNRTALLPSMPATSNGAHRPAATERLAHEPPALKVTSSTTHHEMSHRPRSTGISALAERVQSIDTARAAPAASPEARIPASTIPAASQAITAAPPPVPAGDPATAPNATHAAASSPALPPQDRQAGPVRTMTVQLQPESRGLVTVRMSLRDGTLEIRMEAREPQTAALLRSDREAVAQVMRAAGAAADSVSVTVTERAPQAPGQRSDAGSGPDLTARDGNPGGHAGGNTDRNTNRGALGGKDPATPYSGMEKDDETLLQSPLPRRRGLYL